jgi:hypothetical protein
MYQCLLERHAEPVPAVPSGEVPQWCMTVYKGYLVALCMWHQFLHTLHLTSCHTQAGGSQYQQ